MKENKVLSLILITIIYLLASIVGICVYNCLSFHFAINLLIADIVATTCVFIFSLIFKNSSVYDPYWSVQPIIIVTGFACVTKLEIHHILSLIAIILWGMRLTLNWAYTFKNLNWQDWRYVMLKEKTKWFYPFVNYLGIHMFPTLVVYLCILPVVYLFKYDSTLNIFTIICFIVSICSIILQGISDYQMHSFRKKNQGKLIREGLWKYSRHPNYLGEILMWWGMGLLAVLTLNSFYYLVLGALVNTLMFIFVSIPMAEKHQASRKSGFEKYKEETNMLLPFKIGDKKYEK